MQRIDWEVLKQSYFLALTQKPASKFINQTCRKISVDLCNIPTTDEVADLRSAVAYLARAISESGETFSFDRKTWIEIGMCLKTIPDEGLAYELWILFSQSCSEQFDRQDCIDTWDGLNPTETHWRSLFRKAQDAGWVNPRKTTNTTSEQTSNIVIDRSNPVSWADKFTLTDDEIDAIADPEWLIENLIIRGHFLAIIAEPNGGKTTLLMHLAGEIVKKGFEVLYVNSDTSGGDAKSMHKSASENNFKLMLPDMASGNLSMDDVVNQLEAMSVTDYDFSNTVFIFDTLKKMTDVINKQKSKKLYKLLRSLTSKGMTVIALGHTNKHRTDGELMYEGTGDLRADTDELIYLIPEKMPDGSMIITTKPDKVRGAFEPISFGIDKHRNVRPLDQVVPTFEHRNTLSEVKKHKDVISAIDSAIDSGAESQKQITEYCQNQFSMSDYSVRQVLKKYSIEINDDNAEQPRSHRDGLLWGKKRTGQNNHLRYRKLLDEFGSFGDEFNDYDSEF